MTDQTVPTDIDVQAITAGGAAIRAMLDTEMPEVAPMVFNTECDQLAEVAINAAGKVYQARNRVMSGE